MTARELTRSLCDETSPVSLIYVRSATATSATGSKRANSGNDLLYRRVCEVVGRHADEVELVELDAAEAPAQIVGPSGAAVLFVMRRGELHGQATGPLPTSELERIVATALR